MRIAVLIEDQYQVLEAWYPYLRLKEEGMETVFVGPGRTKGYASKEGYPAPEEMTARDALAAEWDGVVVPGGYAPDLMRRSGEMVALVKRLHEEGKCVAAICHAGWVLISAGVLRGKRATCFHAIKDDLRNAGASYSDRAVVVDGNLITSREPNDLPAFCREIIAQLKRASP